MGVKLRQYVVVPKKPRMSPGKIASQVAHATFMALEKQKDKKLIQKWKKEGMCVIILQTKDALKLFGISKYLEQWGIPNHVYIDEGMTEVDFGTPTALATGVLEEGQFWIFKTSRLFK
jgi:peptidyl-tRNA hydrolase